jgi:hypothetical protein
MKTVSSTCPQKLVNIRLVQYALRGEFFEVQIGEPLTLDTSARC